MNSDPDFSRGIVREPDAVVDTVRVSVSWFWQHHGQCQHFYGHSCHQLSTQVLCHTTLQYGM